MQFNSFHWLSRSKNVVRKREGDSLGSYLVLLYRSAPDHGFEAIVNVSLVGYEIRSIPIVLGNF